MHTDRKNYIFVDYENGLKIDLSPIAGKPVHVTFVTGRQQTNIPKALVKQMLLFRDQITIVENEQNGPNAADFVLAVEVGRQSVNDPKGFYHIVSRDKGFDALVKHLRCLKIMAARSDEFASIPILVATDKQTTAQLADSYILRLQRNPNSRPARKAALLTQIGIHFGKTFDEKKCESVVQELMKRAVLHIAETGKITYSALPVIA